LIPETINGHKTDVIEIGEVKAMSVKRKTKLRPANGGCSLGKYIPSKRFAGTMGGVVFLDKVGDLIITPGWRSFAKLAVLFGIPIEKTKMILTNNHVAADENKGSFGDYILQPGSLDRGTARDVIGTLFSYVKLINGIDVDAALVEPINENDLDEWILEIGEVKDVREPVVGLEVLKSGRTTGLTSGRIISTNATINIRYDMGVLTLKDQILTTKMVEGGDSGSFLVDKQNNIVGLICAGSSTVSVANKIQNVIKRFGCSF